MTIEQFYQRYSFDAKKDRLGSGAFGTVYKAYDHVLNLYKAIKIAKVQIINGKEFSLLSEFKNVKNINAHANIANYEAVYQFETKHEITDFAVMQYYEDGTLKDILKQEKLLPEQKINIIYGLLNGVSHLHKSGIIHRDLKTGNILMARDQKGEFIPKISDFGLSKLIDYGLDESLSNSFQGGSIDYSSPEQLMGLKLMQNTDIWSLGVILFEIFTGSKPFQSNDTNTTPEIKRHTTLVKIFQGHISELINLCPDPYRDIIQLSLRLDPYKRIRHVDQIFKLIEYPHLMDSSFDNELWDEDETIIFGFEEENRKTFPVVFNKFLIDLGIIRPVDSIIEDQNSDEKLIEKRKKYVEDRNNELLILKNDVEHLMTQADNLMLDGFFENAISIYQQCLDIYPSNDIQLKINELENHVGKAQNILKKAESHIAKNDINAAQNYTREALEIYPQFEKAHILNKEINQLLLLKNKKLEFNALIEIGEKLLKEGKLNEALVSLNHALTIFPDATDLTGKIKEIQSKIEDQNEIRSEESIHDYNKYKSIIFTADQAFDSKNWRAAKTYYQKALDIFPHEKYPLNQISVIQTFLDQELSDKKKKADYIEFMAAGDKAIKNKHYDHAIELYNKAASLFQTEALVIKIEQATKAKAEWDIQSQKLKEEEASQLEYKNLILLATNAENSNNYQLALEFYHKALVLSHDNKNIKSDLTRIEDKIKANEILSRQEILVKKAEVSFSLHNYEEANNYLNEAALLLPLTSQQKNLQYKILASINEKQLQNEISTLITEGQMSYQKGLKKEALKIFNQALVLSKNQNKTASELIDKLQNELNQEKITHEIATLKSNAEKEVQQKNYDKAIVILEGLCEKYPTDNNLILRLKEIQSLKIDSENRENEKQDKLQFEKFIEEANKNVELKRYQNAFKLVKSALFIYPENQAALDLKAEIEKLLKEHKDRIIPWFFHMPNFVNTHRIYFIIGFGLIAILAASYHLVSLNKSEKLGGQIEIFKNSEGLYGCKLNSKEIISPTFDSIYIDAPEGLLGLRNDTLFSIKGDGSFHFISYRTPEAPVILTIEWIESIKDIHELYSLINQFPDNPLTSFIYKRIKLLEDEKENKRYREILDIKELESKLAALEQYFREYPKSKFIKEIQAEITRTTSLISENLSELELYNKAKKENSLSLLEDYLKTYPNGKYANEAAILISDNKKNEDLKEWEAAKKEALEKNITQPLVNYLNRYNDYAQEAKELIVKIQRNNDEKRKEREEMDHQKLWESIKERRNLEELTKFLSGYPSSPFVNEASKLKETLEKELEKKSTNKKLLYNIEAKMVNVSGGEFNLGCNDKDCDSDAKPFVSSKVKSLAISTTEVTQGEYQALMGVNPSYFNDCPECPVENVSFYDAMEYIKKLNAIPNNPYKYRLPSEAEWEYFALANKNTLYSGGDDIDNYAIYGVRSGTSKVKSKSPNALGLFDMTGNVAEWCADYYHKDAYVKYRGKLVTEPNSNKSRVIRGGSYKDNARNSKLKKRDEMRENEKADWLGFRLVREIK